MSKGAIKENRLKKLFGYRDLTVGTPIKVILLFAIPILFANLLTQGLNLCNSLVLKATVGGDSVTAMNQTSSLSSLLFNFLYGSSTGFAVIAANAYGKKDTQRMGKIFVSSIFLTLVISLLITVFGLIFLKDLLNLLNVDEEFFDKAYIYFFVILCGFVLLGLNNLFGNFLRAFGNSVFPLVVSAVTMGFHVLWVFLLTSPSIAGLDTEGAAIATLITNGLGALANYLYLIHTHGDLKFSKANVKVEWSLYGSLLANGLPLGFQWSILFIGSFVQNSQVNAFGTAASKGMTCYSSWETYLNAPLQVLGQASLNFFGQNYGAGKYKRVKTGYLHSLLAASVFYVFLVIVGELTAPYVAYIFLPSEDVTEAVNWYTTTYLRIMLPFQICQGVLINSRSVTQGIKKPLVPLIGGIGELIARILVSLYLPLAFTDDPSTVYNEKFVGLCFSNPAAWFTSMLIMGGCALFMVVLNPKYKSDLEPVEEEAAVEKKEA